MSTKVQIYQLRDLVQHARTNPVWFVELQDIVKNKSDISKCWFHQAIPNDGLVYTRSYRRVGATWTRRRNYSKIEYALRRDSRKQVIMVSPPATMKVK